METKPLSPLCRCQSATTSEKYHTIVSLLIERLAVPVIFLFQRIIRLFILFASCDSTALAYTKACQVHHVCLYALAIVEWNTHPFFPNVCDHHSANIALQHDATSAESDIWPLIFDLLFVISVFNYSPKTRRSFTQSNVRRLRRFRRMNIRYYRDSLSFLWSLVLGVYVCMWLFNFILRFFK